MFSFTIALISFLVSVLLTGIFRLYAVRKGLVDVPNERSSHLIPTPRGGGAAIVISFLLSMLICFLIARIPADLYLVLISGGLLVAGIGYYDDQVHVKASWRLVIHFVAVGIAVYGFGIDLADMLGFSPLISIVCTVLMAIFMVWFLNLFNFMDGIDGIAGIEAAMMMFSALMISIANHGDVSGNLLFISLGASSIGFLVWNWPPAKIFMGDVGSGFLGYSIGVIGLFSITTGALSLWVWLILGGVFLVDATVTLTRRFIQGEKIFQAHCSHAYQNAARGYMSHQKVTLGVFFINLIWLFPLAYSASRWPHFGGIITIVALTPLLVLAISLGAGLRDFKI